MSDRPALSWLARIALAASALFLTFAMIEASFWIARAWEEARLDRGESWAIPDEDLGYRLRGTPPNPLGLKSPPVGPKTPGRTRVLMLGDSILHGGSLDDTLAAHAQRRLDGSNRRAELINAGIPGYTTYQELQFLRKYGLALQPDLVGIAFCTNDLHRQLQFFRTRNGKIVGSAFDTTEEAASTAHGSLYVLARRSLFLRWARQRADLLAKSWKVDFGRGFLFDHRSDLATAWQDPPWRDFQRWFDEFQALGQVHGFKLFVIAFPLSAQYRTDYLERDREYVLKPQRRLAEVAGRSGVPLLDLYERIDPDRDLRGDGIHLTQAGRERTGDLLAEFLVRSGLIE